MRLPLFYDEQSDWAVPPDGPQDVEVFCNGDPWVTLPGAITVVALPPAPGTTSTIIQHYRGIAADFKALTEAMAPLPGAQQQVFTSLFAGIDEIFTTSSPIGLPGMLAELEATDPGTLALLDAIFAVGGADEAVAAQRALLQEIVASGPVFEGQVPAAHVSTAAAPKDAIFDYDSPIALSDTELASALSHHDTFKSFSQDFIGKTTEEFGLASGLFTIVIKSKLAQGISTTLTLLDYVMNKVIVSALPAKLDRIELTLVKTKLANSETTSAELWLHASNVPEELKVSDLTSLVVTTLGIAAPGGDAGGTQVLSWINSWNDIKTGYAQTLLDLIDRAFKEYAERPDGMSYDTELFSIIPGLTFRALGQTRDLYLLWPDHGNIIRPLSDQLQWRASDTYWGTASVSITPTATSFGPFGNVRSNSVPVEVGELVLKLDQYRVGVPEGSSAAFGVKLSSAIEEGVEVSVNARRVSGDPDISVASALPLTIDSSTWDVYQDIVLRAAQDDDAEDGEAGLAVSASVVTEDGAIIIEASLSAFELDDDQATFVLDPSSIRVSEGESAQVGVSLSHPPTEELTAIVQYASGDRDIVVQSPTTLRFDEDDWDVPQTVTLHAHADEDVEEGTTQFRVSANDPAEVEEAYITATEDELGARLTIYYEDWNPHQRATVQGAMQVELDPDNFDLPLERYGTIRATFVSDYTRSYTGTAYLQVMNHPMEPACPCFDGACYARQSPSDTILAISGFITWDDCSPCASYGISMILPFLEGNTFETTCYAPNFDDPPDSGVYYSAELVP
jgi:hypothetical protein